MKVLKAILISILVLGVVRADISGVRGLVKNNKDDDLPHLHGSKVDQYDPIVQRALHSKGSKGYYDQYSYKEECIRCMCFGPSKGGDSKGERQTTCNCYYVCAPYDPFPDMYYTPRPPEYYGYYYPGYPKPSKKGESKGSKEGYGYYNGYEGYFYTGYPGRYPALSKGSKRGYVYYPGSTYPRSYHSFSKGSKQGYGYYSEYPAYPYSGRDEGLSEASKGGNSGHYFSGYPYYDYVAYPSSKGWSKGGRDYFYKGYPSNLCISCYQVCPSHGSKAGNGGQSKGSFCYQQCYNTCVLQPSCHTQDPCLDCAFNGSDCDCHLNDNPDCFTSTTAPTSKSEGSSEDHNSPPARPLITSAYSSPVPTGPQSKSGSKGGDQGSRSYPGAQGHD